MRSCDVSRGAESLRTMKLVLAKSIKNCTEDGKKKSISLVTQIFWNTERKRGRKQEEV
jgi:hypothetical protein